MNDKKKQATMLRRPGLKNGLVKERKIIHAEITTGFSRNDATDAITLIEDQKNAEQAERNRKLKLKALMRKAGVTSLTALESVIRRVIRFG